MLGRAFALARRRHTQRNGTHLEWTGPEPHRCTVEGRRIHPRTLFWAVEHGLAIDAVPGLRCGCGNPLCILPAHMNPRKGRRAPLRYVTPDLIRRVTGLSVTQEHINAALTAVDSGEEISIPDDEEILNEDDIGIVPEDFNFGD